MSKIGTFNMEPTTKIEKELGFAFVSDPRGSRFPLPEIPADYAEKFPGELYSQPVDITWEMARDWLRYRIIREDRTPSELKVEGFQANRLFILGAIKGNSNKKGWIDVVKDGEIRTTHQGLAFTPNGFVSDGQHRLAAIYLARMDKPVRIQVSVNVPWEGFTSMDSGVIRQAAHMLGESIPYPTMAAGSARYIFPVLQGNEHRFFHDKRPSKDDVINLVKTGPFYRGTWGRRVSTAAAQASIPNTALMATVIMALVAGADVFKMEAYLDGLKNKYPMKNYREFGKNGEAEDPRYQLRQYFHAGNQSKRSAAATEMYGIISVIRQSMTAWLNEEGIPTLRKTRLDQDLPPVWNADLVREYYSTHLPR